MDPTLFKLAEFCFMYLEKNNLEELYIGQEKDSLEDFKQRENEQLFLLYNVDS